MPFEPLKTEDLSLVNRLIQVHPDLQDTIAVVKQVNAKGKYPIESFDELAKTMGGDHASITFRGRTLTMADARNVIPAYYFPIQSEADLLAKMADLSKGMPPATAPLKTPPLEHSLKLMEATAVKHANLSPPPDMNIEEIFKVASFAKQTPGVGGFAKK